jgi:hypothetical protein
MLLKTGEEYVIPDDLHQDLINAYGEDMVRNELTAMKMWLLTNPFKRKTKVGMPKFINSWLSRAKKTGGVSPFVPQQQAAGNQDTRSSQAKASDSIRGRTLNCSLADITWVEPEEMLMMKQFYLAKYGHYYDGELRNV